MAAGSTVFASGTWSYEAAFETRKVLTKQRNAFSGLHIHGTRSPGTQRGEGLVHGGEVGRRVEHSGGTVPGQVAQENHRTLCYGLRGQSRFVE